MRKPTEGRGAPMSACPRRARRCASAVDATVASATSATTIRNMTDLTLPSLVERSDTDRRCQAETQGSRGDARAAGVAVARVVLQGRPAARAVARRGSETAAALRAELGIRFQASTVGGTAGNGERGRGNGPRPTLPQSPFPFPSLLAQRRHRLRRVLRFQRVVVGVRQLPSGAVELDLFQRAQRDRARGEIIIRIFPLATPSRFSPTVRESFRVPRQFTVSEVRPE